VCRFRIGVTRRPPNCITSPTPGTPLRGRAARSRGWGTAFAYLVCQIQASYVSLALKKVGKDQTSARCRPWARPGLLWVIAPPLPARDIIDDIFWAAIALLMFGSVIVAAHRSNRLRPALEVGAWSGLASGAIACCRADVDVPAGYVVQHARYRGHPVGLQAVAQNALGSRGRHGLMKYR